MLQTSPLASLREFSARVLSLLRKQSLDRELDAELESHLELATEDFLRRGLNPAEARRQARIRLGGIEASRELHRDSRGLAWLEGFFRDIRYAARGLKRATLASSIP